MKKLLLDGLCFEVTRKCNQECAYCMRGKAQNIDINYEAIDKLFKNEFYKVTDINYLSFSGGEPLLNVGAIEYIINTIIENDIYVSDISMITNGLIYDESLIKALDRLNKKLGKISYEQISYYPDQFHKPMPIDVKNKYSRGDFLYKDIFTYLKDEEIYNTGLARENGIGTREEPNYREPIFYHEQEDKILFYPGNERKRNKDGFQLRKVQDIFINALGYVLATGDGEYNMMDKYNLGNILDKDIVRISTNVDTYKKVKYKKII